MNSSITSRPATIAARNERRAQRRIEFAIRDRLPISSATARLIAATIHAGPYTALGRFARCGALDQPQAQRELAGLSTGDIRAPWQQALADFITAEARDGTA